MRCSDWSSDFCSSDRAEHDKASARNAALYSVAIRSVGSDRGGIRGRWCRAGQGNGEPVDKLHARGAAFRTARTPCRKDPDRFPGGSDNAQHRSEEHTSELQSLMRISYAVFCLKKKKKTTQQQLNH